MTAALVERVAEALDKASGCDLLSQTQCDFLTLAALAAIEATGYRIVPVELTAEMKNAAIEWMGGSDNLNESEAEGIVDAALAAAPSWKEPTP